MKDIMTGKSGKLFLLVSFVLLLVVCHIYGQRQLTQNRRRAAYRGLIVNAIKDGRMLNVSDYFPDCKIPLNIAIYLVFRERSNDYSENDKCEIIKRPSVNAHAQESFYDK